MNGIDNPAKAEAIAAHILSKRITAAQVGELIDRENAGADTTDFWTACAAAVGVNFPSRRARERVAEIISALEASHA
jgi:hypothetical protein